MSDDVVELNGLDIKSYISSQRNCRAAATGYVMEPLNSNLIIDLSSFSGNIKASIFASRISGNGKLKINNIYTDVLSKTFHQVDLDIIHNKKIEISRDQNSIGKIIINSIKIINVSGIDVKAVNSQFVESPTPLKDSSQNWRQLLIKSGNVRGIKLLDNKLYASEGAQIQHANIIESLETDPPQSYVISDIIKFVYACEIKSVYFKDEFQFNVTGENKYKHFAKPPVIKTNPHTTVNNVPNKISNNVNNMTSSKNNNIIYDSFTSPLEPNTLINSNEIVGGQGKNSNGLLLKREATFSIPMSNLKPHMQYVIVAQLRKITGNGKFGVAIETTNGESRSSTVIIAPDRETEMYIKLNTEDYPPVGNSYALKVFRPLDSTVGDVLLERLMVIQGITLASMHVSDTEISAQNNIKINKINRSNDLDSVRAISKQYSRRVSHTKTEPKLTYAGSVCVKNASGINWMNKIKPICPYINVIERSNVVLGELGSLSEGEKIWLDPFNEDFIPDDDNYILKKAKVLVSPSLQNVELLRKLYPNAQVHLLERAWPLIETTPLKYPSGEYVVMIHRTKEITERIIESYDSVNNPPLVIIGSVDTYPDFVIQMNEYVTYDKMLGVILNAKLLIDISPIDDYISGILSIAFDSGLPVVTSNWFGLAKNNCKFIVAKDKVNKINIPKAKDLQMGIEDALKLQKTNGTENHNNKLDKILSVLF